MIVRRAISIRGAIQKKKQRGSEQQIFLSQSWNSNNLMMGSKRESIQTIFGILRVPIIFLPGVGYEKNVRMQLMIE